MTRADEVRRLAEDLHETDCLGQGGMNCYACRRQAEKLLEKGWTKPEPPAPRNPVSRETAEAIRYTYAHERKGLTDADCLARAIWFHAPSLVADLAEAAKGEDGFIVVYQRRERIRLEPAALVAALTPAAQGGA